MRKSICKTGSQIPRPLARGFYILFAQTRLHCDNKPWHFSFQPLNVSILNLKGKYGTWSESRFTCSSFCYIMWCPLTTGIVASQFPSSRDAVLVMCFLKPLASTFLNVVKQFYHHQTFWQWICKLNRQLWCCFWHQRLMESPKNCASDWPWEYGDMCLPSLHMRLLATRHI